MVKLLYFTNAGREIIGTAETVEAVILTYRRKRRSFFGANFGRYSIDNGKTWIRI